MPVSSSIAEALIPERSYELDPRRLMAFAAGVGDARPELIDTARAGGIIPHPVLPVAIEWPTLVDLARELTTRGLERGRAMLAYPLDYRLTWERSARPGDVVAVGGGVVAVRQVPDGAIVTVDCAIRHDDATPVTRSRSRVLFPDCEVSGPTVPEPGDGDGSVVDLRAEWSNPDAVIRRGHRRVGAAAAHVFSECADMWNPVYTDKAVALRHGRAFLALPPWAVLAMAVGGALQLATVDPSWVRCIHAEFDSLVPVPSTLEIEAEVPSRPSATSPIRFRANLEDGSPVITAGALVVEPAIADIDLNDARSRALRRRAARLGPARLDDGRETRQRELS